MKRDGGWGGGVTVGWIRSGRERDCGEERWRMGGGRVAVGWIRSGRERDCGEERWRMGGGLQ